MESTSKTQNHGMRFRSFTTPLLEYSEIVVNTKKKSDITRPYLVKNAEFLGKNVFGDEVFKDGCNWYAVDRGKKGGFIFKLKEVKEDGSDSNS